MLKANTTPETTPAELGYAMAGGMGETLRYLAGLAA